MREKSSTRRRALRGGVVLLAVGGVSAPAFASRTVKVESKNMKRTYKETSTRGGVHLQKQLSKEACVEGVSWGFDREGIWVNKGCRAEFQIGN